MIFIDILVSVSATHTTIYRRIFIGWPCGGKFVRLAGHVKFSAKTNTRMIFIG